MRRVRKSRVITEPTHPANMTWIVQIMKTRDLSAPKKGSRDLSGLYYLSDLDAVCETLCLVLFLWSCAHYVYLLFV